MPNRCETWRFEPLPLQPAVAGFLESASAVQWGESWSRRIQASATTSTTTEGSTVYLNGHGRFFQHGFADVLHGRLFLRYNRRLRDRLANRCEPVSARRSVGARCERAAFVQPADERWSSVHACCPSQDVVLPPPVDPSTHEVGDQQRRQRIGPCTECGRVHGTSTEGSRRLPGNGLHPLLTLFGSGVG